MTAEVEAGASAAASADVVSPSSAALADHGSGGEQQATSAPAQQAGNTPEPHVPCLKLFIGNLDFACTDAGFKQFFEAFGPVTDYVVMRTGGKSRGFGFVTFAGTRLGEKERRVCDTLPTGVVETRTHSESTPGPRHFSFLSPLSLLSSSCSFRLHFSSNGFLLTAA